MDQEMINPEPIEYVLKRSNRKSLAIEITSDGKVIVRAPMMVPVKEIEQLIEKKRDWIREHQTKQEIRKERDRVLYRGSYKTVCVEEHKSNMLSIELTEESIIIRKPRGFELNVSAYLEHWYRKEAAKAIKESVERHGRQMQVTYGRVAIKDQKTRWGSCSSLGNLNFNYRLIMAPERVLDYVVVHELAHRVHMNHSKVFWDLVGQVMPEYEQCRIWLKEHGSELMI